MHRWRNLTSLCIRNCLFKRLESFLVICETHKPKIKVIHSYYFYVLLGWLLYILTLVGTFYFVYWNYNLQTIRNTKLIYILKERSQKTESLIRCEKYLISNSNQLSIWRGNFYGFLAAKSNLVGGDKEKANKRTSCS